MTLAEMIAAHPDRFYRQDWYEGHAFMQQEPRPGHVPLVVSARPAPGEVVQYSAADLGAVWLDDPGRVMWEYYLWTCDTDDEGQRIYVGQNGKGLEIHRHLHLTDRWRYPIL